MASSPARVLYLDASAVVKLVVPEPETDALVRFLAEAELVASEIVAIEAPRAAYLRTGEPHAIERVEALIGRFHLVALDDELHGAAARIGPPELRTLDAVHLVSALRVSDQVEAVVAYDRRLAQAARAAGLRVEAPA